MSAPGGLSRLAACAVFVALAGVAAAPLRPAGPKALAPTDELEKLEAAMTAGARLHPAPPAAPPAGSAPFCAECHPGPPHAGTRVADAMANEHGSRMDCLLCHWAASSGPRPSPAWQVQSGSAQFLAVLPPERSTKESLRGLRAAATAVRRCFDRGPGCEGCHRPGGLAGLARPGENPARVTSLEHLENYFTLAPGEKWYFPQFQ